MEHDREGGVALVAAAMAIMIVMALGAALVLITSSETMIASNFRAGEGAFYAADAALEQALSDLRQLVDWNQALDGTVQSSFTDGAPSGVRRLPDGSMLDFAQVLSLANCLKRSPCSAVEMAAVTSARPWGVNNPHWRPYAFGWVDGLAGGVRDSPFYLMALIADDPSETDGDPTRDGLPGGPLPNPGANTVLVRGEAFGPRGTRRTVEAAVSRFRLNALDPASPFGVRVLSWREVR